MSKLSRRHFLSALPSGLMGLGLAGELKAASSSAGQDTELKIKKYNILGKTGLKVGDVSCGAISFFEPNVMRYAVDMGVNYFDTAEGYMNGNSEKYIGQALGGIRDKILIATKHPFAGRTPITKDGLIQRMNSSLKRLNTDHVDVAMAHNVSDLSLLDNEDLLAGYEQLKKEGKVRFTGFSTHNAQVTLKQAVDREFVQVVLVIYNHLEGPAIEPLIEAVKKKGIGVVAMKVFAGGKQGNLKSLVSPTVSYSQAAIRWVLSNPVVDCCIPTMSSYSHVEEYVSASGQPLDRGDLEIIAAYREQASGQYCRVSCTDCLSACPGNVAINDVLRYTMYYEDYRREKDAIEHYSALDDARKPTDCSRCAGPCVSACPHGLRVKEKLIRAHDLLRA
jgi:predicted aldo/keto reductase-like oxidoreductase